MGFLGKAPMVLLIGALVFCTGCTAAQQAESGIPVTQTTAASQTATATSASQTTAATTAPTTVVPEVTTTAPFIPDIHPDTIGIYIPTADGTASRKRLTEFTCARTPKKDIDCFEILASQDDVVKGNSFRSIWTAAWDSHMPNNGAKIGFHIAFVCSNGETVSAQILKPSDSEGFYDYLEIYMYDDIHQTPGAWYTHLEDKDMKEQTIISSIKLTAGSRIAEVGDIALTAFIYTGPECFDAEGNYIGLVSETILVLPS